MNRLIFSLILSVFILPTVALAANNASFVSQSVPATMNAGKSYQVAVTMKNTGDTAWTFSDSYKIGTPDNSLTWGMNRITLASAESVAPGAQKIFSFYVNAPATAGTYTFGWQMV